LEVDDAEDDTILIGQAETALAEALDEEAVEEDDFNALIDPSLRPAIQQLQVAANVMTKSAHEMNEAAGSDAKTDNESIDSTAEAPPQAKLTLHIDPQLQPLHAIKTEPNPTAPTTTSSQISANSLVSPPDSLHNDHYDDELSPSHKNHLGVNKTIEMNGEGNRNDSTSNPIQTPKSAASRHSSRQPKPVDRYIPDVADGTAKQQPATPSNHPNTIKRETRRASSSGASIATTSISSSNSNSNSNSGEADTKPRRASSHTTSTTSTTTTITTSTVHLPQQPKHGPTIISPSSSSPSSSLPSLPVNHPQRANMGDPARGPAPAAIPPKSAQTLVEVEGEVVVEAEADPDPEEESLRLIRALQEDEFGLRRRRKSVRA
jgi:hypothetical protein